MNNVLKDEVKQILARELETDISEITDEAALNDFDKWDSLNHIKIILALENKYNIEVSEETIQKLTSLGNIVSYLSGKNGEH